MCEAGCTRWGTPDSLVPGTIGYHPNPRTFGNSLVGVSSVGRRSVCLGLPCKGYKSIDCRPLTVIRDCLISWPRYPLMMELCEIFCVN
jgi:hypothetical protein